MNGNRTPKRSFKSQDTAMGMRDVMRRVAAAVINELRPKPRWAEVTAINFSTGVVTCQYPDEAGTTFEVTATTVMPTAVGQAVLLDTLMGVQRIIDVTPSTGWQSHAPALTASTTNPTLGTGGLSVGRWKRTRDNLILYRFSLVFGTSGVNAGNGNYFLDLPVAPSTALNSTNVDNVVGTVWANDSSGNTWIPLRLQADRSMRYVGNGSTAIVTHGTPWTWAASDRMQGSLLYEPA